MRLSSIAMEAGDAGIVSTEKKVAQQFGKFFARYAEGSRIYLLYFSQFLSNQNIKLFISRKSSRRVEDVVWFLLSDAKKIFSFQLNYTLLINLFITSKLHNYRSTD